jgi:hypothetical protein
MRKIRSRPDEDTTRLRTGPPERTVAGSKPTASDPDREDDLTSYKHRLRRRRAKRTARKKAEKARARRKKSRR